MKILKIFLAVMLCALIVLPTSLAAFADDSVSSLGLVDGARMLSASEKTKLESKISDFEEKWNIDLIIITTSNYGIMDMESYAQYSYSGGENGILLLVKYQEDGDDNEFWIETFGEGEYAINSYGVSYIEDKIQPYLANDNFYEGFAKFVDLADDFVREASEGEPYSSSNKRITSGEISLAFGIALVAALAVGLITVSVLKHKMNNARPQSLAHEYVKKGSFDLKISRDLFLYSTMSRTPRSNSSSSGGSRSRGSGGGRKF